MRTPFSLPCTVICNEWKPECQQTVEETKLIDSAAPGAGQDAYAKTATAACKLLGYETFGSGTVHMIGKSARPSAMVAQVKVTPSMPSGGMPCHGSSSMSA